MILTYEPWSLGKHQSGNELRNLVEKLGQLVDEGVGLKRLRRILDKVMWAMKARIHNPIGPILLNHCEREEEGILNYLMEKNHNDEEATKEKMTAAVDSTFKHGYNLKVHSKLNQFMVDYDIIEEEQY